MKYTCIMLDHIILKYVVYCFYPRVRKKKERYAQSEMRKQANRMTFGEV